MIQQGLMGSYPVASKHFQVDTSGTLTTGLQAYYKMEDNTDFWSTYNATDTGITYAAGKVNNGSVYSGTAKFTTSYAPSIGTGDFTVSCWYKATGASGNPSIWSTNNGSNYIDAIFIGTTLYFDIFSNFVNYAVPLDGAWHLLICVRSGSTMTMYLDNTSVASGTANQNGGSSTLVFGGRPFDNATRFTGNIDEAGIWTKALSSQERTDIWNGGSGQTMIS